SHRRQPGGDQFEHSEWEALDIAREGPDRCPSKQAGEIIGLVGRDHADPVVRPDSQIRQYLARTLPGAQEKETSRRPGSPYPANDIGPIIRTFPRVPGPDERDRLCGQPLPDGPPMVQERILAGCGHAEWESHALFAHPENVADVRQLVLIAHVDQVGRLETFCEVWSGPPSTPGTQRPPSTRPARLIWPPAGHLLGERRVEGIQSHRPSDQQAREPESLLRVRETTMLGVDHVVLRRTLPDERTGRTGERGRIQALGEHRPARGKGILVAELVDCMPGRPEFLGQFDLDPGPAEVAVPRHVTDHQDAERAGHWLFLTERGPSG